MPSYVTPKKGVAFIIYISLPSMASPGLMQSNPTLASGDFKVSIDGGALSNLATLPTVTPASSKMVKISLSTSEMNGDNITVVCSDAAGDEWGDVTLNIQTSARQIDDLAYPATSGRSMVVDANGLVDANTVKVGPTGSGTAQTAGDIIGDTNDIQSRLPAALVSGRIDASVGAMAANVLTATAINADAITAAKIANGAIDAATFAADVDAEFLSYIVDDATRIDASALNTLSGHDPGETIMGATDLGTGAGLTSLASAADLATVAGYIDTEIGTIITNLATVDTVVDAIQAKTDNLPSDPADASVISARFDTLDTSVADLPTNAELATALGTADDAVLAAIAGLNNLSAAEVNAEVDTALADYDAPTKAELDAGLAALETHGDSAWTTATGFSTHTAADVWSVGTRVLTASTNLGDLDDAILAVLGTPAGASIADDIANISAGSGPTASEIADAVWDEDLTTHTAPDSTGEALAAAGGGGDPTTAARVTDLWQIHGLDSGNPMTVTPTSRAVGTISQTISGDGTTTSTVTRA